MSEETYLGIPRNKIDWSPRIDDQKCKKCMMCMEYCPHNVYGVVKNERQQLIVKNPGNCVVFCRACGKICEWDAISFPEKNETTRKIKEMRKEMGTDVRI